MNPEEELFSDERLEQTLARLRERDIAEIVHGVQSEIETFSTGTTQSDDITMLSLSLTIFLLFKLPEMKRVIKVFTIFLLIFGPTVLAPGKSGYDDQGQRDTRDVADSGVGRKTLPRHDVFGCSDRRELLHRSAQRTIRRNKGADAGIRRPHDGTSNFDGPHAGYFQVLVRRDRITKPGIIAHVDQNACVGQRVQLFCAISVFARAEPRHRK